MDLSLTTDRIIRIEKSSVEVFKTDIRNTMDAEELRHALILHYPGCHVHFDLEDCDNILRMEGAGIEPRKVEQLAAQHGFQALELPD